MRAGDIAVSFTTVGSATPAEGAARLVAGRRGPGSIVTDEAGRPYAVLAGTALMARPRRPLVAVTGGKRRCGAVTPGVLLARILAS